MPEQDETSTGDTPESRVARADDALWVDEGGVRLWRGFDPAEVGTQVFLARARCEPGTTIPPHWHTVDTIAYLADGGAIFRTGADLEQVIEMAAGDWLFVKAGVVHTEETPPDTHCDFLYARDGRGGTTTYVDDVA